MVERGWYQADEAYMHTKHQCGKINTRPYSVFALQQKAGNSSLLNQSICIHLQLEGTCSIFDSSLNFSFNDLKQIYSARKCFRHLDQKP